MADETIAKKRGRPSKRSDDNGQVGGAAAGAGANDYAEGESMDAKPVVTWAEFDKRIYAWELENKEKRITRVFFDGADSPMHFAGLMSECDLSHGKPAIRLSTGEIIEI